MKHIYKGLALCAAFAFGSMHTFAQEQLAIDEALDLMGDSTEVQVAFRSIDRQDLLGGISVVDVADLSKKAYTTSSLDFIGNVVGGVSGGTLWGMDDYLVVVDGMVRDYNNVLSSEIDQITLLKGAAAVVLYGSRASKGVIQITTKRGHVGPVDIKINVNSGMHTPKSFPKYLGSAEYMSLYNEALINDGSSARYSDTEIYRYASGENPYRYPDVDMYSWDYLRKAYNRSEAVAEISGGNQRVRFYTTTGYLRESSLLKVGNAADNYVSRFFVRGNVDMKLHDLITAQADANVTFYDAYTAAGNWWSNAATFRPNRVAPLIPLSYIAENDINTWNTINNSNYIIDGKYFFGGSQQDLTNPIAASYAAGDSKYVSRQFQFNSRFDINLRPVLQGLFFRAKYGIDYASVYTQGYTNTYATFQPTWTNSGGGDMIASVTNNGTQDEKTGDERINGSSYRYTYNVSLQFDYNRTFNTDHNVFAMILGNAWQTQQSGEYHRITNLNMGVQASYNYQHKYYADLSIGLPYSTKLPEGNRMGFSPTLTLGWRPVKEAFFQNTAFDDLMLTASAGMIMEDLDITDPQDGGTGYYLYRQILQRGGWFSWADLGGEAATEYQRSNNYDLTFVKRKEFTVGLKGSLWNKLISFDFNYFTNRMDDGLTRPSSLYPNYFTQVGYPTSSILPIFNFTQQDRSGFDYSVYVNKKVNKVDLTLGVSGMYYTTNNVKLDESYGNAYQTRMGRPIDAIWGLESLGFFRDQADIDASPSQTSLGEIRPGDIKYKDQNGDGFVDVNDEVFLGRWDIPFRMGINLTVKWRNFTLFAMGNGYFGGYDIKNSSYYWVNGEGKYSEVVRNRWTPETANTATYPRLTAGNGGNNNRNSDFWMYKTDYFNLGAAQLTYDLPEKLLQGTFIKGVSVYVSGYNLLMISKERKHLEMTVGGSPETRFYNLGLKGVF